MMDTGVRLRWAGHRGAQVMDTGSAGRWAGHGGARVTDTGVRVQVGQARRGAGDGHGGQRSSRCQQPGVLRARGRSWAVLRAHLEGSGDRCAPASSPALRPCAPPPRCTHRGGGFPRPRSPGGAGPQRAAHPWTLGAASAGMRDEAPERSRRGWDPSLPLSSGNRCEGSKNLWFPPKEKALPRERRR